MIRCCIESVWRKLEVSFYEAPALVELRVKPLVMKQATKIRDSLGVVAGRRVAIGGVRLACEEVFDDPDY